MKFSDIIGQQKVKERLVQSFKAGRLPHAQLFIGNEGNGKMALAMAYAQYINCHNPSDTDACGHCPSCVKYEKLQHPDLHFVFPVVKKSGTVISDNYIKEWRKYLLEHPYISIGGWMRELNDERKQPQIYADESVSIINKLSKKAYEAEYKVMIIYSPERMNISCANKLLKLIEEPAPKTILLMVSDVPENIITTIRSRCQTIQVPPISGADLSAALVQHHYQNEENARRIGRMAGGSYIRAQEMLVQDETEQFNFEQFRTLMRLAFKKDVLGLKQWTEGMVRLSKEGQKAFFAYAQHVVRESFMANFRQDDLVFASPIEADFVGKFAPFNNETTVVRMLEEFEKAQFHLERNVNANMVFFDLALKFTAIIVNKK